MIIKNNAHLKIDTIITFIMKVEAEPAKNSPAAKMVARFIWFIVEANNLYPLLNCTSHSYIIHTSKATKTNDVSCKLFIAQGQHDWLTKDPYIWENVGVAFEPPSSSPEAALFSIGSSTVVAKIPGMIQEMSDLVKAGKPFILSTERMKKFQRTLLRGNYILFYIRYFRKYSKITVAHEQLISINENTKYGSTFIWRDH